MSRESARARALLWWRQAAADLRASGVLAQAGEWSHSCFQAQQAAEKSLKALLAVRDQDLRSHSLQARLRELSSEASLQWASQARTLDKLYAPTRYPDALGDAASMDVFGPEDAE
ncbi:HEPN domain-containing protein [Vulcanococcus sp.]|jgi:HEPN domain-containing protein|uniref:HEPN domain-containing protein n=1 Tax=Vulcanococcus sp. TaxID=2856995 RepID=UPI0037D9CF7D